MLKRGVRGGCRGHRSTAGNSANKRQHRRVTLVISWMVLVSLLQRDVGASVRSGAAATGPTVFMLRAHMFLFDNNTKQCGFARRGVVGAGIGELVERLLNTPPTAVRIPRWAFFYRATLRRPPKAPRKHFTRDNADLRAVELSAPG